MSTVGEKVSWLREQLEQHDKYPTPIQSVSFAGFDRLTNGMYFFPGNLGLYDPNRERISTIVLGSDWGNEDSFKDARVSTSYKKGKTTAATDGKLRRSGFDLKDCWYSNAWPVLRESGSDEEGYHPMRDDAEATKAYQHFLRLCIDTLKPKLIITFGIAPAWFVGPHIEPSWKCGLAQSSRNLKSTDTDTEPIQIASGLVFVSATHPSHPGNERHRMFNPVDGNESGLLVRARRLAGIPDFKPT